MNDKQKEVLISWLNDAHAMELSLIQNLEEMAKDAEHAGKGDIQARLEEHIEETRHHAEEIESCITRLGGSVSAIKDTFGKTMGFIQGSMKSLFSDVLVKNALEGYAAESMEIAAYTSLIAAAEDLGDMETADVCARILVDEERMADWVLEQIPIATRDHLATKETIE